MDSLKALLPPHEGYLPKWLFFVSVISVLNSIQAYSTIKYTQRVYDATSHASSSLKDKPSPPTSPVTALSARTFGTWTFLSSIIRLYAAYNISNPQIYQIALWTYGIAFAHFVSEWMVFKTAKWGPGLAGPVVVSTCSMVWMVSQWGYYVK